MNRSIRDDLQVAGAPDRWEEIVYRGDLATGRFLMFQLLDGAFAINSGRDMRFARTLVAPEKLADGKISLQDLCLTRAGIMSLRSEEWLEGGIIECPRHDGRIEVKT